MWMKTGGHEETPSFGPAPLDGGHVRAQLADMIVLPARSPFRGYAEAALMVAAATLIGLALAPRWGGSAVDLLYLPAVVATAVLAGLWPALFAAAASAL